MTFWQRVLHRIGMCPKYRLGYNCQGRPGECGFEVKL